MGASTHHEDYQLLLKLLKDFRVDLAVPQTELAQRLEVTQTFISKVERGERRLDVIELIEILEALGIAPEEFLKTFLQHRKASHKKQKVKRKITP